MNAQRRSQPGDGGPAAPTTRDVPVSLARRARPLVDAIAAVIADPRDVALTERQRAEARDIARKLIEGIEIDLLAILPSRQPAPPVAWRKIAARGLPVEGLARHVLARVLERSLEDDHAEDVPVGDIPSWAVDEPKLAALWMRYAIADRRRRDGWRAPMIIMSDLPLECHAALVECVAGALLAAHGESDEASVRYAAACAQLVSLHREETGIAVAAAQLVDAALALRPAGDVIDELIRLAAWPAIAALTARFAEVEQDDAAILLSSATADEIEQWLSSTELGAAPVASLCRAIELADRWSTPDRDVIVDPSEPSDETTPRSPVERIALAAERYRTPGE